MALGRYRVATVVATRGFKDQVDKPKTVIAATGAPVRVSHRALKNQQGQVFRQLAASGDTVLVTNRERVDGVLLSPDAFATLRDAAAAGERLLAALPLLMGAARSGVAVPSETAERVGLGLAEDWRALNELLSTIPVALSHGEEGEPLARGRTPLHAQPASEDDEELRFSS